MPEGRRLVVRAARLDPASPAACPPETEHVRQTLARADAQGATLREMLDATGLGIVQLDARGRIAAANDRASDLLRDGTGLFDRDGLLYARMPWDDDDLRELLRRALPPLGARSTGGSTIVRRLGALPPLVLIVDPAGGAGIDPATVAAALDLTGMETRIAMLLTEGMTVREIAAAIGRKESTLRSHVKHIFARHGLSRQAQRVRLVRSLVGAGNASRRVGTPTKETGA